MIYIFFLEIMLVFLWVYVVKNNNKKKINQIYKTFEESIKLLRAKLSIEIDGKVFTNLNEKEISDIEEVLKKGIYEYGDYYIYKVKNTILLEDHYFINENTNLRNRNLELGNIINKLETQEYEFYRKFSKKLFFLLKEFENLYEEVSRNLDFIKIEKKQSKILEIERLKSKIEFLIKFYKHKGETEFVKYKLETLQNLIKTLKRTFNFEINLNNLEEDEKLNIYIEVDKIFIFLKVLFYSFQNIEDTKIEISFSEKRLHIKVLNLNVNFKEILSQSIFNVIDIENGNWKTYLSNESFLLDVPIKIIRLREDENIKNIIIDSDINKVSKSSEQILFEMKEKGFNEDDLKNAKLILNELLINAIEHGNKYDKNKEVIITYNFYNKNNGIRVEIEDEGQGFDVEGIKKADILSERGRGVFLANKLSNYLKYLDNGKKVVFTIEKEDY